MAVEELGGKTVVRCIKSDTPILGKLANVKLESDLEGLGGAIVEVEDGTVRIDLRIETLYDIKRDSMRKDVYDKIFTKDK
jgi:vacuolar-type H+-ATPase subunit E/Vma4